MGDPYLRRVVIKDMPISAERGVPRRTGNVNGNGSRSRK